MNGNSLSGIFARLVCLDVCSCTKYQDRALSNMSLTLANVTDNSSSSVTVDHSVLSSSFIQEWPNAAPGATRGPWPIFCGP